MTALLRELGSYHSRSSFWDERGSVVNIVLSSTSFVRPLEMAVEWLLLRSLLLSFLCELEREEFFWKVQSILSIYFGILGALLSISVPNNEHDVPGIVISAIQNAHAQSPLRKSRKGKQIKT